MSLLFRGGVAFCIVLLSACAAEDDSNFAPTVSAGSDVIVAGGQTVTLTATAEDTNGTVEQYAWTQTSGTTVVLENADTESLTFEAPVDNDPQVLEFKIIVTDNENSAAADFVTVNVNAGIAAPSGFSLRLVANNAILQWDEVENAESYVVYSAFESFSDLATIDSYAVLDGADRVLVPLSSATTTGFTTQLRNLDNNQRYFFTVTSMFTPSSSTLSVESAPATEISRLIGQTFTLSHPLNDTTVSLCVDVDDDGNVVESFADCPVANVPGQDGELGRTAEDAADNLSKEGSGIAGFDRTRLDADGEELSPGNQSADCYRDNQTGLVWEIKRPRDSLRRATNRYSWYNPNADENGGDAGLEVGPECGGGVCSSFGYATRLNQVKLCGLDTWRLPTVTELRSTGDIARACLLDGAGCPVDLDIYYLSGTTNAADVSEVWRVALSGKPDVPFDKSSPAHLIMVAEEEGDE